MTEPLEETITFKVIKTAINSLSSSKPFATFVRALIQSDNAEQDVQVTSEKGEIELSKTKNKTEEEKERENKTEGDPAIKQKRKEIEQKSKPSEVELHKQEIEDDLDIPEHLNLLSRNIPKPEDLDEVKSHEKSEPHLEASQPAIANNSDPVIPNNSKEQPMKESLPHPIRRQNSSSMKKVRKVSSGDSSVNLQLTLKSKNTRNLSNTQNRADSLIYSDATLAYSSSALQLPQDKSRLQSHQSAHEKESKNLEKIQRAVSRQMERSEQERFNTEEETKSRKLSESAIEKGNLKVEDRLQRELIEKDRKITEDPKSSRQDISKRKNTEEQGGIFQTEIKQYKNKIARIRDMKEQKKRKLEAQLKRVNDEIQGLTRKQTSGNLHKGSANYESRVKISDNLQAKIKAEKLVKNLNKEKKQRHIAHLGDLQAIDKNINYYMEELALERVKNEERLKQRKKIEIIERMKQHEVKKIQEQQQKNKNLEFLSQLKQGKPRNYLQSSVEEHKQSIISDPRSDLKKSRQNRSGVKERSITKASEKLDMNELTPELSRKKEFLKKVRNLKFKKDKVDVYQQALM